MSLIRLAMLSPDFRQRPGQQNGHQQQKAYECQLQADIAAAIEQRPGAQHEPADKGCGDAIDPWMQVAEDGFVVRGHKFPTHGGPFPLDYAGPDEAAFVRDLSARSAPDPE